VPPGLYTVHLKFAEVWLPRVGERPMDITINGRLVRKSGSGVRGGNARAWPSTFAVTNITPDKNGHIVIALRATGANDAILQAIEIE